MIETSNLLTDALSEALETMAFLDVMPIDDDAAVPEKPILGEISFTGCKSGTLRILVGLDFAKILAENIGALDEADDESCRDAVAELSNVTCGLLLPMLADRGEDVFDVTVPTVTGSDSSPSWEEMTADPNTCALNVEGYAVGITLITRNM
jgi:CheY-specific phosphatase CheX